MMIAMEDILSFYILYFSIYLNASSCVYLFIYLFIYLPISSLIYSLTYLFMNLFI